MYLSLLIIILINIRIIDIKKIRFYKILNNYQVFAIFLLYLWLIFHLFYIGNDFKSQLAELKGTWLRALIGAIIGYYFAIGLQKDYKKYFYMILGLFAPFLILLIEYIPVAIKLKSFFIPYYFYESIFVFKTNASLAAISCISVITSLLIWSIINKEKIFIHQLLLSFIFILIVLYDLVVIMETRSGFTICMTILTISILYISYHQYLNRTKFNPRELFFIIIIILFLLLLLLIHLNLSPQWKMFLFDFRIAIDTENYFHWQNTQLYGYPNNINNQQVSPSTYERVAWFKIGLELLNSNLFGNGKLDRPFINVLQDYYPNAIIYSTLSGWMDIIYAIGIPGFFILFSTITYNFISKINKINPSFYINFILGFALIFSFTFSEFAEKHGIEILLFYIGFFAGNNTSNSYYKINRDV